VWGIPIGIAICVRAIVLWQLRDYAPFQIALGDARVYLDWAGRIAAGDVWSRFQGVFYQPPLYPYVLALIKVVGGESWWAPRLVQLVVGSLTCGLLADATRRWLDPWTGLVAGLLLAALPAAVFYDLAIGKAGLAAAAACGLVWLMAPPDRRRRWGVTGVTLGLLVLLRENAILLLPVLGVAALAFDREAPVATRGWRVVALLAGFVIVVAPVALRNRWVGGDLVLTTSQAGVNFYIGNHGSANGTYQPLIAGRSDTPLEQADARLLAEEAAGRTLDPAEVSRYWFRTAVDSIQSDSASWIGLLAKKCLLVVHAHELPDLHDLRVVRGRSSLLDALWRCGGSFGVLVPLAVVGFGISIASRRSVLPLVVAAVVYGGSVALFFVFGRYRHPLVAVVVPLAAAGIVGVADGLCEGRWRRIVVSIAGAALVAVAVNWPIALAADSSRATAESNVGAAEAARGRLSDAVQSYRNALDLDPNLPEAHLNLGTTLLAQGRAADALPHLERVRDLMPRPDSELEARLALALVRVGRVDDAQTIITPLSFDGMESLAGVVAVALAEAGAWEAAVRLAERVASSDAGVALVAAKIRILAPEPAVHDPVCAARWAEASARASGWTDMDAVTVLVRAAVESQRPELARSAVSAALEVATDPVWITRLDGWRRQLR
jgi:tetratricopeptide (TPR) repeat protein